MKFVIYKDIIDQWRWRLVAANSKIIADSAEGYKDKRDCLKGIELVKAANIHTEVQEAT